MMTCFSVAGKKAVNSENNDRCPSERLSSTNTRDVDVVVENSLYQPQCASTRFSR